MHQMSWHSPHIEGRCCVHSICAARTRPRSHLVSINRQPPNTARSASAHLKWTAYVEKKIPECSVDAM